MVTTRLQTVKIISHFTSQSRGEVSGHDMKMYGRVEGKRH
jgi:hypothetical protein